MSIAEKKASKPASYENVDFSDSDDRYENMKEQVEDFVDSLAELTDEARRSERFKEWLEVQSKFHDYSFNNTLLIMAQKPDASKVAGYRKWQREFDRHVKQGESAIWIWAPVTAKKCPGCGRSKKYHDEEGCRLLDEGEEDSDMSEEDIDWIEGIVGFRPVPVFDISQTEGEPLPDLETAAKEGERDGRELLERLQKAAEELDIDLSVKAPEEYDHRGNGWARDRKAVALERTAAATASTVIHEFGHIMAGHTERSTLVEGRHDRSRKEIEAESIAYVVGRKFGLDVENSKFYLAAWEGDSEKIEESLSTITRASKRIIETIEDL